MRAGPSGEERCTPHYTVPVSPQCPQEISLLTLPVFQGAAVSSERFSQSLPPRNVAELGGSCSAAAFLQGHSHAGGSRAGSGNGTRSEHSPEGGDHRGGPCSRQRVRILQPYFIVPGKGVASVLDLS